MKFNKLRRITRQTLTQASRTERDSFNRWLATHRPAKNTQQEDLPSSQLPSKMSLVRVDKAQLFVIIDTCSIVKYRPEFIDFVVHLKQLFSNGSCPIKFIISLVVLEELDKCNRPQRKQVRQNDLTKISVPKDENDRNKNESNVRDVIEMAGGIGPPRMFMRFIEEEMRSSEILISDLDPFKKVPIPPGQDDFEIVNNDDRILDCCIRSKRFVDSLAHHPDTRVVLVTEDNVFKSKATTFSIVSYRWFEFKLKFKNFGLDHYTSTPIISSSNTVSIPSSVGDTPTLLKLGLANTRSKRVLLKNSLNPGVISTKRKIPISAKFRKLLECKPIVEIEESNTEDPITIVKEVINLK